MFNMVIYYEIQSWINLASPSAEQNNTQKTLQLIREINPRKILQGLLTPPIKSKIPIPEKIIPIQLRSNLATIVDKNIEYGTAHKPNVYFATLIHINV